MTLYSGKNDGENRQEIESKLLQYSVPLTIGQRHADWFNMKGFFTGTMVSKIVGGTSDDSEDANTEQNTKKISCK